MDNVTPITKSQQDVVEGFLADVLGNISAIQPKACLVLMVSDLDPQFLVLSDSGLSIEGAIAMLQAANLELVKNMTEEL
jgi:hypothetical protein